MGQLTKREFELSVCLVDKMGIGEMGTYKKKIDDTVLDWGGGQGLGEGDFTLNCTLPPRH